MTPLYSLENDVLGVWRLNCFCPADGFVINKESPALFLSQSFFHLVWEKKTNDLADRSKESTSQKSKFQNLPPE